MKPAVDDSYEDVRPAPRERVRNHEDDADDYEYERRSYERPRNRNRPASEGRRPKDEERRPNLNERRLSKDRRPSVDDPKNYDDDLDAPPNDRRAGNTDRKASERRPSIDDRKSNVEDRKPHADEPRRGLGDRRRPYADRRPLYDDEDEELVPPARKHVAVVDEEEDDRPAKFQPPKPKNGVVPKVRSSSPVASIFSRPRQPPRINRPVPNNEKKKYEYVSKAPAQPAPAAADEEQYDEYDYEEEPPKSAAPPKPQKVEPKGPPPPQRKPAAKPHAFESEELEDEVVNIGSRNSNSKSEEKVTRNLPKVAPVRSVPKLAEPKPTVSQPEILEEEEGEFEEYADAEPDQKEEEAPEDPLPHREDVKPPARPGRPVEPQQSKPLTLETEPSRPARPQQRRPTAQPVALPPKISSEPQQPVRAEPERDVYSLLEKEQPSTLPQPSGFKPVGYSREQFSEFDSARPMVRVVKRPFLPSRGGSPYLPRGLKPVGSGIATSDYTLGSRTAANVDQSHITGIHLLQNSQQPDRVNHNGNLPSAAARPTLRPQETLRSSLDDIYNSDYDVTINDALNPTLKPISQSHESPVAYTFTKYDRSNPYARSDASQASSVFRSTAIQAPLYVQSRNRRPAQTQASRPTQQFYDDYEY